MPQPKRRSSRLQALSVILISFIAERQFIMSGMKSIELPVQFFLTGRACCLKESRRHYGL
jgi:hypothetical protein